MKLFIGFTLFLVVLATCVVLFFSSKKTTSTTGFLSPTPSVNEYALGDVNEDGQVDTLDTVLIEKNKGCVNGDVCWGAVVGYTQSGHNPIYTSDLDLNKDSVVDLIDTTIK